MNIFSPVLFSFSWNENKLFLLQKADAKLYLIELRKSSFWSCFCSEYTENSSLAFLLMPFRRKISFISMLLTWLFIFLRHLAPKRKSHHHEKNHRHLVLCLFRFIIVKCSLKCNIFLCCLIFSMCHERDGPLSHKSFRRAQVWMEQPRGDEGSYLAAEAPNDFYSRPHLISHNCWTYSFPHVIQELFHQNPLFGALNSTLLSVVMCLSWSTNAEVCVKLVSLKG